MIGKNCVWNFIIVFLMNIMWSYALECWWNKECAYRYFSSKTSYESVRGDIRDSVKRKEGCTPISIWGMFRHGKRNPGIDYGRKMQDAIKLREQIVRSYNEGNSSLCAQDVENLKNFNPDRDLFLKAHYLSNDGYKELFGIGRRFAQAFPDLLTDLKNGSYKFRPTFGVWIEKSAEAFVEGVSSKRKSLLIDNVTEDYDFIAPYATCGKYQRDVKSNPKTYIEPEKYQRHQQYLQAKTNIEKRAGIHSNLTAANLTALYDLCRYLTTGFNFSPWCALFSTDDLKVFEYEGDLRHYYRNGYGNPLNEKFGHPPMEDLLLTFRSIIEGTNRKITAYFSHATMMDMIYTALGLFKDEKPLTGDERMDNRKWKSSNISVFGANLVAVLNRCLASEGDIKYNVDFYLNEKPLNILCDEGTCTWRQFENTLKRFVGAKIDFCEFTTKPH